MENRSRSGFTGSKKRKRKRMSRREKRNEKTKPCVSNAQKFKFHTRQRYRHRTTGTIKPYSARGKGNVKEISSQ